MSATTPAPTTPNVERLTTAELDALPVGTVVRFLDDPGRRHVVAFKSGERVRGVDYTRWLLSDGGVFLSAVALADIGAVLHDPVSDTRREDERLGAKFRVYRVERTPDPTGKHVDCQYFVLDPQHDPHAVAAIRAYSAAARSERPALADDLDAWVGAPLPVPPVVDEMALAAALGDLWDDGNTKGLDGWIGLDRGEGDVDQYAVMAREKAVDAALTRLIRHA